MLAEDCLDYSRATSELRAIEMGRGEVDSLYRYLKKTRARIQELDSIVAAADGQEGLIRSVRHTDDGGG